MGRSWCGHSPVPEWADKADNLIPYALLELLILQLPASLMKGRFTYQIAEH